MKTILTGDGRTLNIGAQAGFFNRNDQVAERVRARLDKAGIKAVDIMGSVGAGKTTLTGALVKRLTERYRVAAIAGDLTTDIDAERIRANGGEVLQINTDKGCHLDANMIDKALDCLDLDNLDVVLIENVGNLICPSGYRLGAHKRLVVIAVTEGPYQVLKHPHIFQEASAVVINKIDLAQAMEVDPEKLKSDARTVKPGLPVVMTQARHDLGIDELITVLELDQHA